MNKKQKSSIILGSLASIAIAGTVIAGSTYALFTSESKTNIAVTSGIVDVSATIGDLETFSGVDLTGDPENDTVEATAVKGVFTNGGTASIGNDGALELTNVTPGDKATFKIEVSNKSNVTIKYRTVISSSSDDGLFSGLDITVGEAHLESTKTYSSWATLEPSEDVNIASLDCSAILPSDAGNEYQEKSCKVNFAIEAVQGNAYTEDVKFVNMSLTSGNTEGGSVSGTEGSVQVGEEITISATANEGYLFKGWYENNTLVSSANPYTFTVPSTSFSYVAKFVSEAEEQRNIALGITPVVDETNLTITYGLYPQSRVKDSSLISTLETLQEESNGWYLYNDVYYAKDVATPKTTPSSYTPEFVDFTTITNGETYWYKCEPITWNILSSDNGTYSVLSKVLLDTKQYNTDRSNNKYSESSIRSWLNNEFFNSAFNLDSSLIQTTEVDNSASTTKSSDDTNISENTFDKIYLLSWYDYKNNESIKKKCKPTDYSLANGGYYDYGDTNCGWYWTRSPNAASNAWYVYNDGSLDNDNNGYVDNTELGVRPAMTIKL